jgi:DNA sulfur modification protein DndE
MNSMFTSIKTSKENKEVITRLTRQHNLGAENVIARIALAYSLAQEECLDLKDLQDSGGKEYSKSVLFGENLEIYLGMVCLKYGLYRGDKDLHRYVKLHVDRGLFVINNKIQKEDNFNGTEFVLQLI